MEGVSASPNLGRFTGFLGTVVFFKTSRANLLKEARFSKPFKRGLKAVLKDSRLIEFALDAQSTD